MGTFTFSNKGYAVDTEDYLSDFNAWDEDFARGMAPMVGIITGLSDDHWKIIRFIRDQYNKTGRCPLVYETCRMNRLHLAELKRLFPAGYLRGACKLAGVTYREGYLDQAGIQGFTEKITSPASDKTYQVDARGFLVNPFDWDETFAVMKAHEMKMPKLTDRHWRVVHYLRERFTQTNTVPRVYETCEDNGLELEDLEELFPDGYHRGAVKVSGLRLR